MRFMRKTFIIVELEIRKILHDPTEIFTRAVQPVLWLLVFGEVFAKTHLVGNGQNYIDFISPGILAQSILFISIFYGIAIIWERDLGITHKFLATPTPRLALVLGKAISAGIRCLPLAVIIYILCALLGVALSWNVGNILLVLLVVMLGAVIFSTFSLIMASIVKTRERFMGIGQILTMPLFFASNAIYPIDIMPSWLKVVSHVNPLTFAIDALRELMIGQPGHIGLVGDFAALTLTAGIVLSIGSVLYKNVIA